ncbi:DUF1801 domain-containing protein [Microvirga pakistanensis]|uniref:DUF1801 domain-containing protein n=1 Tax=Microvirga pakistanensis TaxID=1682650 RepID=UPI00313E1036
MAAPAVRMLLETQAVAEGKKVRHSAANATKLDPARQGVIEVFPRYPAAPQGGRRDGGFFVTWINLSAPRPGTRYGPTIMNPSEHINQMIADLPDWRGPMLADLRQTILATDPGIIEEWKWMGSPTWSLDGLIAVGNPHKNKVKLTFAYGAALPDPDNLFNGNDKGNTRRSIDIFEGRPVDKCALQDLVRAAVAYNRTHLKKNAPAAKRAKACKT